MNTYEQKLRSRYEDIYRRDIPDRDTWVQAPPAIPFVGDNYGEDGRCKVLVYGSAENLNYERNGELDHGRNREEFERWRAGRTGKAVKSMDNWFPWVHMTPISDGTLLTVARYLLHMFRNDERFSDDPIEFLQQIAVVNYGKLSLKGSRNADYASKPKLLGQSDAYVVADMDVLQPEVVILPVSIHWNRFDAILKGRGDHKPGEVWRIYQTNTGVINRTVKKQLPQSIDRSANARPTWVSGWTSHISKGIDMAAYLDWLDWKIATGDGSTKGRWPIVYK